MSIPFTQHFGQHFAQHFAQRMKNVAAVNMASHAGAILTNFRGHATWLVAMSAVDKHRPLEPIPNAALDHSQNLQILVELFELAEDEAYS